MRGALPAALALVLPTAVAAQRTSVAPSFAASEIYDGNLFASASDPQETLVHRFGPRLELRRQTPASSLVGNYSLDAEYVQVLAEEGVHLARQLGSIELAYRPLERVGLEAEASYLDTRALAELSPVTGVDAGRLRGQRFSAGSSVGYELGRRTRTEGRYGFSRDVVLNSTADMHAARADLSFRFTRKGTGTASLLFRHFVFEGDPFPPSQILLLGWRHQFARRTSAAVLAGPRFREAEVEGVEVLASARQGVGRAELEASYTREETTTAGFPASLESDAGALSTTVQLDEESSFLAGAGLAQTLGPSWRAGVLHGRLEATTKPHPWLSVALSLTLVSQRFEAAPTFVATGPVIGPRTGRVFHEQLALTVVVAPPKPLELP